MSSIRAIRKSVAAQMSSINGAWLDFAKNYDLANNGLDRLYPQQDGVTGRWRIDLERQASRSKPI